MPTSSRPQERVFVVAMSGDALVVERSGAPFRRRYLWLAALLVAVLLLLVGYLFASRINPWFWFLVGLVLIVMLALAERAVRMRGASSDERFVFDKEADRIERNGSLFAPAKEVEAVLFREILEGDRPTNEYAVAVAFEDTRRMLVGESQGMPGDKETLEGVASAIGEYLGVEVRNEPRQAEQWWLDRS